MRRISSFLLFCILVLALPLTSSADDTVSLLKGAIADWQKGEAKEALIKADQATQNIWQKTPLYIRKSLFTSVKASAYGMYHALALTTCLAPRRPLFWPTWNRSASGSSKRPDGMYKCGFRADLAILDLKGNILVGKENFMQVNFLSHVFNREIFLNVNG